MSAAPILMLGPGGDYVTRFDAQGKSLTRSVGNTWGQQPDTDSAGSFAGYTRMPKRGSAQSEKESAKSSGSASTGPITRGRDTFEHAAPSRPVGTYQRTPTRDHGQPSTNLTLIISSLEAWLAAQQRALRELSASLAATLPTGRSARVSPRDRVAPMARGLSLGAFTGDPHRRGAICRLLQDSDPTPEAHAEATRDVIASIAPATTESHLDESHVDHECTTEEALPANLAAFQENDHEQHRQPQPHPQAASHPHPDPRPARGARLLADDAGIGGRAWREQGHGLRARRGADQERRALAAAQQGTLFGG